MAAIVTRNRFVSSPRLAAAIPQWIQCTSSRSNLPSPSRSHTHPHLRTVTSATKPDHIPSLHTVPRVSPKPGGWHPTLVHSSGEVKWTVIRLQPDGGEVPKHSHSTVWDYFVPLEGEAVIETETKDGVKEDFEMKPGAFLAVGPEDTHRVRNKSKEREFVFLIAQSPRSKYDFIAG